MLDLSTWRSSHNDLALSNVLPLLCFPSIIDYKYGIAYTNLTGINSRQNNIFNGRRV